MKTVGLLGGVSSINVCVLRGKERRERTVKITTCYLTDV
jgi:hypothetical protein